MGRDVLAQRRPRPGQHIEDARGHAGIDGDAAQQQSRERRVARGLEDRRTAGRQCRGDLPCGRQEGKVPRDDLRHHPDWFAQGEIEETLAHRNGLAEILVHGAGVIVKDARCGTDLVFRIRDGLAAAAGLDLCD
jgi:hypothetical protein